MKNRSFVLLLLNLFSISSSFAQSLPGQSAMPKCFDGSERQLSLMDEAVIQYKSTMPNLQKIQVLVQGTLVKMMGPITNSNGTHLHFIISLRGNPRDSQSLIEIAASMSGYTTPSVQDLQAGPIFLCGEYSTTNINGFPKITSFEPSVTGAMIHWTHEANNTPDVPATGHPHGWIYANGKIFGRAANGVKPNFSEDSFFEDHFSEN